MASEPGSGQAERLHPFFTAARSSQNGSKESTNPHEPTMQPLQTEHIPIDPMVLAMDSNAGSYTPNGNGPSEAMGSTGEFVSNTMPAGDFHGVAMPTTMPYAAASEYMQPGLVYSHQDLAAYGTCPYQTPYQQQPDHYGTMQAGPTYPTYTPAPQYSMPTAGVPPFPTAPSAESFPSCPTQTLVPKLDPTPIPIAKNAFAMLQAKKKKPAEKAPAPAPEDNMQTRPPEPKRRGRPPKKRKSSFGEVQPSAAPQADTVAAPETPLPVSVAPTPLPTQSGLLVKASAPIAPNAANPLRLMMTKAANPSSAAPTPSTSQKRLEATCQYGPPNDPNTARFSQIIGSILEGKHRVFPSPAPPPQRQSQATPTTATTTPAAKKAHPLFAAVRSKQSSAKAQLSGGSASKASAGPGPGPGPNKQYTSTPCAPKWVRSYQPSASVRTPQFGASNGILRVPGACQPAWPSRDNVHVRPDDQPTTVAQPVSQALPYRKRKGNAIYLCEEESLLSRKLKHLSISSVVENMRNATGEHFPPPPPELRLPKKHIESGKRLKSRIAPQLRSRHPGLDALSDSISTTLSAFDKYSNEASMWTQKYAPSCAQEVLQYGDEPLLLRNWLEALKVVAVDTGSGDSGEAGKGGSKAKPKKKRKKNKMDGFIVSSDDDADDDLVEESEDEAQWTASGKHGKTKKTAVRPGNLLDKSGRAAARLNNVVVISGPHGSGKSASVYAVAKELGFEVFEISAGSRRTGKDVTDRIGNMTTNHLVQHKKKKLFQKLSQDEDALTSSMESTSDLEDCDGDDDPDYPEYPNYPTTPEPAPAPAPSAKQQTMNSFFKPKAPPVAAPGTSEPKPQQQQSAKAGDAAPSKTKQPGEQKQSLILLEEADILYEEDKQFWTTVNGLITQSKRPFVITCTDESLIPLRLLRLHAIFRFSAPPVDPAVDRLLLVAASEGHALKREAAKSLFEARDYDMRASLTDLQFWCQIAVGAKASRYDWFVPRQPAGIDQDSHGHTTRIVSENTYWPGMGWLNHDVTISKDGLQEEKEDIFVQQAWNDWQLDMGQWQDSLDLTAWASQLEAETSASREERLEMLDSYCSFAETMSDADMVSHKVFATGNHVEFDATEPEHPPGGPDEYPVGMSLLDRTTAAHENDHLRLPMATSLRCLAKAVMRARTGEAAHKQLDHVDAARIMGVIHREHTAAQSIVLSNRPAIARVDIAEAFDPIAVKDTAAYAASSSFEPSVFDRNLLPIVVDVAPYVRSILAHDERLKKKRQKLGTFLSEAAAAAPGAGAGVSSEGELSEGPVFANRRSLKRMRTTRTALSALEGGSRSATRSGNWFTADINPLLVMHTAGQGWRHAADVEMARLGEEAAKADAAAARAAQQAAQQAAEQAAQQAAQQAAMAAAPTPIPAGLPYNYTNIAPFPGPDHGSATAPMPCPPSCPPCAQVYPAYGQRQVPGHEHAGAHQADGQHDAQPQNPSVDPTQQLA